MPIVNDISRGNVIVIDGELWMAVKITFQRTAQRRAIYNMTLKNVKTAAVSQRKFQSAEVVELAMLDKRQMEYLYPEGVNLIFMDTENYEQVPICKDLIGESIYYLRPNVQVIVTFYENNPLGIELPAAVELKVIETEALLKGATLTNKSKPAILETGLKTNVPAFIAEGEVIKVDTRSGEYLERAK